ncbi:MAG: adenylyl-sulfate kinase [Gammaproteobacteria bacterium]
MTNTGVVMWLTGLSGSGKTTIAAALRTKLMGRGRAQVALLDGDELRAALSPELGFTKEDRQRHIGRIAYLASVLARHGVDVIVAVISPYREMRAAARAQIADFLEVFVECPLERCIERDPKGLYRKALAGEIARFTGVSDPYEVPEAPEVTVHTDGASVQACVQVVLDALVARGHLAPDGAYSPREEAEVLQRLEALGYV